MFPKLAHYGHDVVAVVVLSCIIIVFASFFVDSVVSKIILDLLALVVGGFSLYFFRDPESNS